MSFDNGPWKPEKYDWGSLAFYLSLAAMIVIVCFFLF